MPSQSAVNTHLCPSRSPWFHLALPSLHSVTNHPMYPVIAFLLATQRDRLPKPGLRPATSSPCRGLANSGTPRAFARVSVWTSPLMRRLVAVYGRIVLFILRAASSFPVALHPASRRCSYLPALGSGHLPREDLHISDHACSQAHSLRRTLESRKTQSQDATFET